MEFKEIRLKDLRLKKELSQKEISSIFGVTQHGWSLYESGNRVPTLKLAIQIAAYFKTSVEKIWVIKKNQ